MSATQPLIPASLNHAIEAPQVPLPAHQAIEQQRRLKLRRHVSDRALGVFGIVAFLVLWELLPRSGVVSDAYLSPPSQVWTAIVKLAGTGELTKHVLASVQRSLSGLVLAIVLGDKGYNYRKFNAAYRKGLVAGGNFVTLTIENLLAQGSRPSFISEKEALAWNKDFIETEVIPDDSFSSALLQTIDAHNRVEFGGF